MKETETMLEEAVVEGRDNATARRLELMGQVRDNLNQTVPGAAMLACHLFDADVVDEV